MKATELLLAAIALFTSVSSASAQGKPDVQARARLEETLQHYLEGGTNGDLERLTKAFHPDAQMKFVRDGQYQEMPIKEYLANVKTGQKANRKTRIVLVDVTGNAATARTESEYDTFKFIDYFNLLEINGEWKIVSKIFYREEKNKL